MKKEYDVIVTEMRKMTITVMAENEDEAMDLAQKDYFDKQVEYEPCMDIYDTCFGFHDIDVSEHWGR